MKDGVPLTRGIPPVAVGNPAEGETGEGVGVGGATVMKSPRTLVTSENPCATPAVTSLKMDEAGVCTGSSSK